MAIALNPGDSRREGVPARLIRLADGGNWGLAMPTNRYSPRFFASEDAFGVVTTRVEARVGYGYPLEIQKWIDGLRRALDEGEASRCHEAFAGLAIALLRRAHDLSNDEAGYLIAVSEPEIPRLVREVMAVVATPDGLGG